MKTSILNGNNIGQLEFNYSVTYRPRFNVYTPGMEKQIVVLFKDVNYSHICYSWENDKYTKMKHSHSLINTTNTEIDFIDKIKINLMSNKTPYWGKRELTYTEPRNLYNPLTGEKINNLTKKIISVDTIEISGKHGSAHIERILNKKSASIYTMKFTDIGANFGYIQYNTI
jgi:hypothetical protein